MPFHSTRAKLALSTEAESRLKALAHSRTEPAQRVERAQILLAYAAGESVNAMARRLGTNRPKIELSQQGPEVTAEAVAGEGAGPLETLFVARLGV